MSGNRDERIKQRAHAIWDREGRPEGEAQRHWQQAEHEVDQEDAGPKTAKVKKPAATKKPAASKAEGASRKTTGAGPAIAKRSKDAKKPAKG